MLIAPYKNEPFDLFDTDATVAEMRGALDKVRTRFGETSPLIINGERVMTDDKLVSTNPSNPAEIVGFSAKATQQHADAALDAAWKAFESWKRWTQEDRSRVMLKAAAIMRRRKRELEAWLVYEIGKNYVEASAEVAEMIDFTEYYARQALTHVGGLGSLIHYPGEENESFYIPLGAGVTISPWNFPMALMTGMTVGAIVVGNTVVCKPAEDTVVSLAKVFDIFEEAGLPPGVVNYLPGNGRDVGSYLVAHPRTRFVNFTGSLATGAAINESAAKLAPGQKWFKRVFLELGGKDGILVDETANLDDAATGVIQAAFGYSGQKCSACSRLIVVDAVYDALIERVIERTKKLVVDEAKNNPSLGPVCNEMQYKKVQSYIDIGRGEGKLLTGGKVADAPGYLIEPTIFGDVSPTARIAQEEVFGPFVAAIRVKDFAEGLQVANNTVYGLTGALFSNDRERIEIARREFHVGNLYFNRKCTGALVGIQPFGGFNLTGTDTKTGGPDYLLQFMQIKAVAERL
ncbi:L-glutamate gamma-semialdehyde dehydrogenase [Burkholderia lata]|uniref:L-glutamate gamma-semialdehyde dehydrogenase n=1 Tax=Burkholderia lata (strain ATCC 17760 / DSM 23089 / LMG 22485 / NCIMB 9086 / R18194 / 383) TaxID=482957 RepID=A0A6P2YHR4_BURL3|nr:L-glutamate gamma-semialdehyde dehydrogenase [Burkholderia lata]VWD21354.1 aldehyde dehydrogenase [Burkholderia lata]